MMRIRLNSTLVAVVVSTTLLATAGCRSPEERFHHDMETMIVSSNHAADDLRRARTPEEGADIIRDYSEVMREALLDLRKLHRNHPELKNNRELRGRTADYALRLVEAKTRFLAAVALSTPRFIFSADYRAALQELRDVLENIGQDRLNDRDDGLRFP